LSAEQHIMDQLRCNLCSTLFTAELPDEVLDDGARAQKYGYSARAMMATGKFFMGNPYYRQESFQNLLGVGVSASTIYDQCRLVADDAAPIVEQLKRLAANAERFFIDDTGNRILGQEPIDKPNRNGSGIRMRTGVYTSGLIASLPAEQHIALFQTNIGHAGEWVDEVLAQRGLDQPAPILMSDGLSSNTPTEVECHLSKCNAHSRRKFSDIVTLFPEEVEHAIDRYSVI